MLRGYSLLYKAAMLSMPHQSVHALKVLTSSLSNMAWHEYLLYCTLTTRHGVIVGSARMRMGPQGCSIAKPALKAAHKATWHEVSVLLCTG